MGVCVCVCVRACVCVSVCTVGTKGVEVAVHVNIARSEELTSLLSLQHSQSPKQLRKFIYVGSKKRKPLGPPMHVLYSVFVLFVCIVLYYIIVMYCSVFHCILYQCL